MTYQTVSKAVNETLAALKVEQHPDKTFIGRISRGFDFLGYTFSPEGLAVAAKTVARFAERVTRLYEQGADDLCIGAYARRWRRWVVSGLGSQREHCLSEWLTTGRGWEPLGLLSSGLAIAVGVLSVFWPGEVGTFWINLVILPTLAISGLAVLDLMHDYARMALVVDEKKVFKAMFTGLAWPVKHWPASGHYLGPRAPCGRDGAAAVGSRHDRGGGLRWLGRGS